MRETILTDIKADGITYHPLYFCGPIGLVMQNLPTKCTKHVDENKSCQYCNGKCVKNGFSNKKQRYLCKDCKRSFVESYTYNAYNLSISANIKEHLKEGCGIRSISRLLKISPTTVLKRILIIAKSTPKPIISFGKQYELDEMCTYVYAKTNQIWIVYALQKDTKEVVCFSIGKRTKNTLKVVADTLILSNATKVYTDRFRQYGTLLPKEIHCINLYGTNRIERKNLSLRTHLKRLARRTICFSKSTTMLWACLAIYFWG